MTKGVTPVKLVVSCVIFDSTKFQKILLIKREKPPYHNMWAFPGGKLEINENIFDGMEREVYEETGYKVKVETNTLLNVLHSSNKEYLIITGMAFLRDQNEEKNGRSSDDLNINKKFFFIKDNFQKDDILWNLLQKDCIPNLFAITKKFIDAYGKNHQH